MSQPDWSLYRALDAVLTEGSLSGAARTLGLTQPTLGRQIAQLEAALGVALFTRSPQGLRPTDAARDLAPHAAAMAAAAIALARAASGGAEAARGVVRLTASEVVGAEVLPPMLASFRRAHPGVGIELALNNQTEDLLRGQADLAVRMVRPSQAALVARRIGTVGLGLYAHRAYLETAPPAPRDATELAAHTLIGFDRETPFLRATAAQLGLSRADFAFRADSDLAQLAAVRAGIGVGFVQHGVARRDPALIAVCPSVGFSLEVWLAVHEDLRASRRVRLIFDHLAATLTDYVAAAQA